MGTIAYVENWLGNGDITTHVANAAGKPLCGGRYAVLYGPHAQCGNRPCRRCHRLRPEAFPGEFDDATPEGAGGRGR